MLIKLLESGSSKLINHGPPELEHSWVYLVAFLVVVVYKSTEKCYGRSVPLNECVAKKGMCVKKLQWPAK